MESLSVSSESVEYVKCRITAFRDGTEFDPTEDNVAFAATVRDVMVDEDVTWSDGSWETTDGHYYARVLYGTDLVLAKGHYLLWVKVTDDPETPVKLVGRLDVI